MAMAPKDDLSLHAADIQLLSSRDRVLEFFTRLGYSTGEPMEQRVEAMGLTSEDLKRNIRRIERIADQDGGVLEVYLAELKSVTQASIQALARGLRDLESNFLWVLTSDYDRLDFVLFERTMPQAGARGITFKGAYLRPRTLTVSRQNPGPIALRVLKRFTNTEPDAYYQWDKLRSAYNIADWTEQFFNNRALFSDYYLNVRLRDEPEWREKPEDSMRAFGALFANVRERLSGQPEDVIRRNLFEPVFRELGFSTQQGKPSSSDAVEPDYYLYASPDGGKPLAFCSAYVWDRALDGRDGKDTQTPDENPGAIVVSLLDREDAPDWAIVTNGKTWRLYSRSAHSRATNYYEVDLEEALASPSPSEAFRYFWLIFRSQAFEATAGGQPFLNRLLEGSAQYAKELEERLKNRAFEEIFPKFAEGFIAHIRASEGSAAQLDSERLSQVFEGTLTFLYRLLFLLYAEARGLLPVKEERGYHGFSLTNVGADIATRAGNIESEREARLEKAYSTKSTELYDRLALLFEVIDRGEASLNVPLYNGGLFSTQPPADDASPEAANALFLASHKIPDRYLAMGLDLLARDVDRKTQALVPIDYKSLGVRQLGSVYEGILEFKVRVALEPMAVVKGKKTDEVIPRRDAEEKKLRIKASLAKGAVYLENDKRERKATGSYYTPDYIVKYIVEHTVGPVLDEKLERLREGLREAQRKHSEAVQRQKAFQKQGMAGDDPEKVANTYRHLVDQLFDVRVLDPAMGSGHFLVEAVDYITDHMLKFLNAFPWNPVVAELRRTRESIMGEMERQGVTVDPARLTDVNLLKRHVLKRCIYGVDLNPMAVELAKVSLWLDSFTLGAPLSFLDHHLKHGNSLIGVWDMEKYIAPGSIRWQDFMRTLAGMVEVSRLTDSTAMEIKESNRLFEESQKWVLPTKQRLNVSLAASFADLGNVSRAMDIPYIAEENRQLQDRQTLEKFELSRQVAADRGFFHWKLEFPEAFVDLESQSWKTAAGFDVVVGNPPYGLISEKATKQFCQRNFMTAQYQPDSYVVFVEEGVKLVKSGGFLGYIVPTTFVGMHYFSKLREFMLASTNPERVVKLTFPVFEDATVESALLVLQRVSSLFSEAQRQGKGFVYGSLESFLHEDQAPRVFDVGTILQSADKDFHFLQGANNSDLLTRLSACSWPANELLDMTIGVKPYQTGKGVPKQTADVVEARTFDAATKKDDTYKRYLMGRDIDRYEVAPEGERWISYGEWLAEPRLSAPFFEPTKILVRQTADRIIAARDVEQFVTLNNLHNLKLRHNTVSDKYLLSLLNSRLLTYFHRAQVGEAGRVFAEVKLVDLGQIPIRRITFTTPPERREALAEQSRKLYERCIAERSHECVVGFVEHHLSQQPEEADIVHDLLAYVAERMIALNKEKQAEQKRFLGWLEGELHVRPDKEGNTGLGSLTGKSKLQNYLGDYQKAEGELPFDALIDALYKNKGRLGVSLTDARFAHRLQEEYERSLGVLRPIKAQLALTDSLIDRVVYRLYGLTEEEIGIVEGTAASTAH